MNSYDSYPAISDYLMWLTYLSKCNFLLIFSSLYSMSITLKGFPVWLFIFKGFILMNISIDYNKNLNNFFLAYDCCEREFQYLVVF